MRRAFLFVFILSAAHAGLGQCRPFPESAEAASACTEHQAVPASQPVIDPRKAYRLDELIDIAEGGNPRTRIAWEAAKQAADRIGIARSAYFPRLAALALSGNSRIIEPFPEPLAPRGYVLVETPAAEAGVLLQYSVFDFGRRSAELDAAKVARLASAAAFQRTNQEVAFRVVIAYYNLVTAQERLGASQQIVKTAQTTEDAAEAQLANGRATLPDALNARAAVAQATYDLQASIGAEGVARVELREALGAEPSDEITVEPPGNAPLPTEVTASAANLVSIAVQSRPDLRAIAEKLNAANAALKVAQASYRPEIHFQASAAQQSLWPSANFGTLGDASQTVWSIGIRMQWNIFDGGLRKNQIRIADSERREAEDELREKQDAVGREVWSAYLQFQTAARQSEAAEVLLVSAQTSSDASIDAYGYGVKNLIDVVAADAQLAKARLAQVQARSALRVSAVNLDFVTGTLLRQRPPVTQPAAGATP